MRTKKAVKKNRNHAAKSSRWAKTSFQPGMESLEDRTLMAGGLDSAFGGTGYVFTDLPANYQDSPVRSVLQSDGKLVAAGTTFDPVLGRNVVGLARYGTNGRFDPTFGFRGLTTTDLGAKASATDVRLQADGKIVVVGNVEVGPGTNDMFLVRYTASGVIDTSFGGGDGIVTMDFGGKEERQGLAIDGSGRIIVVGKTTYDPDGGGASPLIEAALYVGCFNSDGTLDTSFDTDGKVVIDLGSGAGNLADEFTADDLQGAAAVAIQSDGKIVATSPFWTGSQLDFGVFRFNTNGSLDTSFSGDGIATLDFGADSHVRDLAIQSDGKIVLVGQLYPTVLAGDDDSDRRFLLGRLNTDGTADTGFDGDGKVVTDWAGYNREELRSIVILGTGQYLVGGNISVTGSTNPQWAFSRYNTDGSLDTTFGTAGLLLTDIGPSEDAVSDIEVQADGKFVVLGNGRVGGTNDTYRDFVIGRYNANGTLDTAFGNTNGLYDTVFYPWVERGGSVTTLADGKILRAGSIGFRFGEGQEFPALARYLADGTLDTTFGTNGYAILSNLPYAVSLVGLNSAGTHFSVQPNGKILIASTATYADGTRDLWVARFNANGTLDTSFSGDGIVTADLAAVNGLGIGTHEDANGAFALATGMTDGDVIVTGTSGSSTVSKFAAVRFDSTGNLVWASFADFRDESTSVATSSAFQSIVDSQGRVVIVGRVSGPGYANGAIARFLPNGTLDASFGGNGMVIAPSLGASVALSRFQDVDLLSDDSIIAAGNDPTFRNPVVVQFDVNGNFVRTYDTSFAGGLVQNDVVVGVDSHDRIVVSGSYNAPPGYTAGGRNIFARFLRDGTLDTSFDSDGWMLLEASPTATFPNQWAAEIAFDNNDHILFAFNLQGASGAAAGLKQGDNQWGLVRIFNNDAPTTPTFDDITLNEGQVLTVTASDPDTDPLTYRWDFDNNGSYEFTTTNATLTWSQLNSIGITNAPASRTVRLQVDDGRGHVVDSAVVTLTFSNVAPAVNLLLDPTFGTNGLSILLRNAIPGMTINNSEEIARQSTGKFVFTGRATIGTTNYVGVWRVNADGSLDTTFGADYTGDGLRDGIYLQSWPGVSNADSQTIGVQADDKIVVGGRGGNMFLLARFNADGTPDTTFGTNGVVATDVTAAGDQVWELFFINSTASQDDWRIVASGSIATSGVNRQVGIVRYKNDGSLDTTFGGDGMVTISYAVMSELGGRSMTVDNLGRVLITGTYQPDVPNNDEKYPGKFHMVRFDASGNLDATFGVGGTVIIDFGRSNQSAGDVLVQPDGKIVTFGGMHDLGKVNVDFLIARFNDDGSLDTTFGGGDGYTVLPVGLRSNIATVGIERLADGRFLTLSSTYTASSGTDFLVARWTADGLLDTTFGSNGLASYDFAGVDDEGRDLILTDGGNAAILMGLSSSSPKQYGLAKILLSDAPRTLLEGGILVAAGSFSDPGNDTWTTTVNYGDGTGTQPLSFNANKTFNLSHQYTDNGTYTITVTVTDGDGIGTSTLQVLVTNVAPTAIFTGSSTVEGSAGTATFTGQTDPSSVDSAPVPGFHYRYALTQAGLNSATDTTSATGSFAFAEEGAYTVWGRIYDKDGGFTDYSTTITVGNANPTASFNNTGPVAENSPVTVYFMNSQDSAADTTAGLHYSFALTAGGLAGTYAAAGTLMSHSFTFPDNQVGDYTVYGRIFDKDGGYTDYTTVVVVTNALPSGTLTASTGVEATTAVNVSFNATTDPSSVDAASLRYSFALNQGDLATSYAAATDPNSFSNLFTDSGTYTVFARLFDKDGGIYDTMIDVTVTNVSPTATFSIDPGTYVEGGTATVRFTGLADPAPADQGTLRFSFATSPAGLAASHGAASTNSFTSLTLPDSGAVALHARIFDKDGGFTDYSTVINVGNVAPTATLFSNGPANEGSAASFGFTSGADASSVDAGSLRYSVALSPGGLASSYEAASAGSTLSLPIDDNGTYTVYGRVFDKDGGFTDYTTTVTVNNLAPSATLSSNASTNINQLTTVSFASVSDPSATDAASLRYSLSLDPSQLAASHGAASASASGAFQFDTLGSHTVYGRIFDKDGGFQDVATTIVVRRGDIRVVGADAGGLSEVKVYDAETNELKFDFIAFGNFTGGARVAAADVNGDGVRDIIVGAGAGALSQVNIYDGTNGGLIRAFIAFGDFRGGVYVAGGDMNGDGAAEVVVGADAGGGPQVMVFDGKTGGALNSFHAMPPSFTGGVRVAVGDLDGDGRAEVIAAAGAGAAPQVTVHNGLTGQVLRSFYAFTPTFAGGVYVAAGDVNGDGRADIITGAGAGGGPQVTVYDGATNGMLASFYAMSPNFTGGVRVGAAHVNGDDLVDILTSAGPSGGPQATSFDSATLSALGSFFAYDPKFTGGVFTS